MRVIATEKCVRAAMQYVGRCFMHRKERSVPYIIVAGFRMVLIFVENYNKPKSEDSKQPGCPEEKVKAMEDAMRHFKMIL